MSAEFKIIIKKHRPKILDSTMKTYLCCLKTIAKKTKLDLKSPEDFIDKQKEIMEYLSTLNPNPRKTKLSAIVVLLDDRKESQPKELADTLTMYRKQMNSDAEEVDAQDSKQELNEKQEKNWLSWDEVLRIYDELEQDTKYLWKKEHLTKRQFWLLQDYVLLSCYVLISPRRSQDYVSFKIRDYDESIESKDNYMLKGHTNYFIFNNFKNAKKLKQERVEIPYKLRNIITKWMKHNPYDTLLINQRHGPVNQTIITKTLNRIFDDKKISSSMLRHIWLTHKYGDIDLEDLEQTANDMGNNQISRILKYVKRPKKNIKGKGDDDVSDTDSTSSEEST